MLYFTSDLHFYHKRIIEYCQRPFENVSEMNAILIENWNKTVQPKDDVIILGDFCFGTKAKWRNILNQLNGTKYLIIGNHDKDDQIPNEMFESVGYYDEINYEKRKFCLMHYPIESWNTAFRGGYQLHGHIHSKDKAIHRVCKTGIFENNPGGNEEEIKYGVRMDVGVDAWNYYPVSINEIIRIGENI